MGPCILYRTCTAVCSHEENTFREDCSWAMDNVVAKHLAHAYGYMVERVALIAQNENLGKRLAHGYSFLEAEVAYCSRNEYCETTVDFIATGC